MLLNMKNTILRNEECVSHVDMHLPIFPKQARRLEVELANWLDGGAHDWIWRLCQGVESDEEDRSFLRVYWCPDTMRFLTEQQRRYIENLFESAISETELAQCLWLIKRYQEGEQFECAEDVESYLDAQLAAGYAIDLNDELYVVPEEYRDVLYTYVALLRLSNAA